MNIMTTIYNRKHESLPRLRGEYQKHLRTYKFDADDSQTAVFECFQHEIPWTDIEIQLTRQEDHLDKEDLSDSAAITCCNFMCIEVNYSDFEPEYNYTLHRINGYESYTEIHVDFPIGLDLHAGDLCTLTVRKAQ